MILCTKEIRVIDMQAFIDLRQEAYVFAGVYVCLSVCLSVCNITQKVMDQF